MGTERECPASTEFPRLCGIPMEGLTLSGVLWGEVGGIRKRGGRGNCGWYIKMNNKKEWFVYQLRFHCRKVFFFFFPNGHNLGITLAKG